MKRGPGRAWALPLAVFGLSDIFGRGKIIKRMQVCTNDYGVAARESEMRESLGSDRF